MADPFALPSDLRSRWPSYPGPDEYASVLLDDASTMIRERWPDVDDRVTAGTLQLGTLKRVVCQMVKRAMSNDGGDGVESVAIGSGTLNETVKYANPDGNLYFTKAEITALSGPGRAGKASAIDLSPGVRPDWL